MLNRKNINRIKFLFISAKLIDEYIKHKIFLLGIYNFIVNLQKESYIK
jgi:hypothetical protein